MVAARNHEPLPAELVAEIVWEICARLDKSTALIRFRRGPARRHGTTAERMLARLQARRLWPKRDCACGCETAIDVFPDGAGGRARRYAKGHSAYRQNNEAIQPYMTFLCDKPGATTSEIANHVQRPLTEVQYTLRLLRQRGFVESHAEERREQGRPEHEHRITNNGKRRALRAIEIQNNRLNRDRESQAPLASSVDKRATRTKLERRNKWALKQK